MSEGVGRFVFELVSQSTFMNPVVATAPPLAVSVSIVTYRPDTALLERTFLSLRTAFDELSRRVGTDARLQVVVVDNGDDLPDGVLHTLSGSSSISVSVLSGHGNVGYGAGHNLAIEKIDSDVHLVLNPDVKLKPDTLVVAVEFFRSHERYGLIAPRVYNDHGGIEHLCRRYPSVLTLFVRGFLPRALRGAFQRRLAVYEMRDKIDAEGSLINASDDVLEPPIISGCFMLFRTSTLKAVKGFDPSYFLYFEDYDLSLRTAKVASIAYVPAVEIVHSGGGASRKGGAHIRMFMASAFRFFQTFGWKWI